jgi:hypothetical protein
VVLGWIADTRGTKSALVLCGMSLLLAISLLVLYRVRALGYQRWR